MVGTMQGTSAPMTQDNIKNYTVVRTMKNHSGTIGLYVKDQQYIIYRFAVRGKITNFVYEYELVDNNQSQQLALDLHHGHEILNRIEQGEYFSDAFIFYKNKQLHAPLPETHSELENKFTSTGVKFWRHQQQMFNYRDGRPGSIISSHISPEGACNLKCPYCSVTYRDTHSRIPLETIKDYVTKLKTRGLRAVILTGGGEPTAYKQFAELVRWLNTQEIEIALVTNGSRVYWDNMPDDVCKMFTWVRVSINIYPDWEQKTGLPLDRFDTEKTMLGCSMVYTVENQYSDSIIRTDRLALLKRVSAVADRCGARYIRMLPNCLLEQDNLVYQHQLLDTVLQHVADTRFFHQYKVHATPKSAICHQSYFRPYLSEEIHHETGLPGTVYPCDSVVLNNNQQHYAREYQLCHASDILDYLDKKIPQKFDPRLDCRGCVHTNNVNMLEDWKNQQVDRFKEFSYPILHENFV
jgi:organic radical activating enzyme